jgi:2-polyprenyl-6-methoxyphenol hydroxylase-like FAD-dependent oxidoreductase
MSPFVGQGANMAMVDGFLVATLIARAFESQGTSSDSAQQSLTEAFRQFQSIRFEAAALNVKRGRQGSDFALSEGAFRNWMFDTMLKYIPLRWLAKMTQAADKVNDSALIACNITPVQPL